MTAQASADRDAVPAPVAPATIVRVLVRPLTKVLNPLMVRLAGRRFFPMAQAAATGLRQLPDDSCPVRGLGDEPFHRLTVKAE